jgi:hypothetical protein
MMYTERKPGPECGAVLQASGYLNVECILSVLACYKPLAVGKNLNKGIELNYYC